MSQSAQVATAPESVRLPAAKAYWWKGVLLILVLGWLYESIVARLAVQWYQDPNFSHGFFVPLFAGFVVWQERARLAALPLRPSWWGLAGIAGGLAVLMVGVLGAELFLSRVSL